MRLRQAAGAKAPDGLKPACATFLGCSRRGTTVGPRSRERPAAVARRKEKPRLRGAVCDKGMDRARSVEELPGLVLLEYVADQGCRLVLRAEFGLGGEGSVGAGLDGGDA